MTHKLIDPAEFADSGYLQEVNRTFLHPLGLALAIERADDGTATFVGVWDSRDDPEGIIFVDIDLTEKADSIAEEWDRLAPIREAALGYIVQPAGGERP